VTQAKRPTFGRGNNKAAATVHVAALAGCKILPDVMCCWASEDKSDMTVVCSNATVGCQAREGTVFCPLDVSDIA
jgi:hypothetical protein